MRSTPAIDFSAEAAATFLIASKTLLHTIPRGETRKVIVLRRLGGESTFAEEGREQQLSIGWKGKGRHALHGVPKNVILT